MPKYEFAYQDFSAVPVLEITSTFLGIDPRTNEGIRKKGKTSTKALVTAWDFHELLWLWDKTCWEILPTGQQWSVVVVVFLAVPSLLKLPSTPAGYLPSFTVWHPFVFEIFL